jgi:hypothetical protein
MKDPRITSEYRTALAELARTDKKAFAEVITEYVDPVYLTLDIASTFMSTKEMKYGEILVKRFQGKYHVRQLVPGQVTLGEQVIVRDKAMSIALDSISAKAEYNTLELDNGGPDFTPEKVKGDVQKALQEQVLMRTWNALANIWTSGNASALTINGTSQSNFINVGGPLTSTALDAAIDHVNFWSEGGVKAIIGTESALAPLSTFGQYQMISGSNSDNYVAQNGQPALTIQNVSPYGPGSKGVETYRGVTNIVRIKQIFDKTEYPPIPLLPTNYVLVVGEDIGQFITYGAPGTKEYIDNRPTPPYWNYETWLQYGMMIWNARGLVKIQINTPTVP